MIRNLKILGLALGAMLAFGALSASGASAQQGMLTGGPVTLTGEETPGAPATANRLTAFGGFVQCPGSEYTGHKFNETPHGLIPNGATTATLTPHYAEDDDNCVGSLNTRATVDMNGCDYVVHIGDTTPAENEEGTYGVTFDVVCPDDKEITVTLWTTQEDHTNGLKPFCDLHVADEDAEGNPTNQNLTGAHVTDEGNGHLRLAGEIVGIHVTRNVTAPHVPSLLCSNNSTKSAKFDLDVTVSGHDAEGKETPISLSH